MEPRDPVFRAHLTLPETGAWADVVIDTIVDGLAGGGLRMSPSVSMGEVARLARTMTHKWAALGMPFGGAKIGVKADPTDPAKDRILAELGEILSPLLNSYLFTGPDMGTRSEDIRTLYRPAGTNAVKLVSHTLGADGTLKHHAFRDLGGPEFETTITGWGVYSSTAEACSILGIELEDARVSIQGFGSVGGSTAKFIHEKGAKVVSIADIGGTVSSEDGLDIPALLSERDPQGTVSHRAAAHGYELLSGDAWLRADADIVIPAAVPDAISEEDARRLSSKLIVEAANIPVSEEAERILHSRGIFYVPDFIANAGLACSFGLVVTGAVQPEEKDVYGAVANRIRKATREVIEGSRRTGKNPRDVAEDYAESVVSRSRKGRG